MNARMDTIRRLAESDPYWRGYLDGMGDRYAIRRDEPREEAWSEYARLMQARVDRWHSRGSHRTAPRNDQNPAAPPRFGGGAF